MATTAGTARHHTLGAEDKEDNHLEAVRIRLEAFRTRLEEVHRSREVENKALAEAGWMVWNLEWLARAL